MKIIKHFFIIATLVAISSVSANAQWFWGSGLRGNGKMAERVFTFSDFTNVRVSSGIDLYLEPSGKNNALLVTDSNILDLVEVSQENETVVFKMKRNSNIQKTTKGIKIYLSYKNLKGVKASGGSDVYMKGSAVLKADDFNIEGSGGSDFRLLLDVVNLNCSVSGGSDAYLSGNAEKIKLEASGGSDIKAKELVTQIADIKASGGSDIIITVKKSIKANASGGSDVYYYGNPANTMIHASSSSDIYRR